MQRRTALALLLLLMTASMLSASQTLVYKGVWKDKFWWCMEEGTWYNCKDSSSYYAVLQVADDGVVEWGRVLEYWKEDGCRYYAWYDPTEMGLRFWILSNTVRALTMSGEGSWAQVGWGKVKKTSTSPVASSYSGYTATVVDEGGEWREMGVDSFSLRRDSKRSAKATEVGAAQYFTDVLIPYMAEHGYVPYWGDGIK